MKSPAISNWSLYSVLLGVRALPSAAVVSDPPVALELNHGEIA